jgi:CBS domain-containing protein
MECSEGDVVRAATAEKSPGPDVARCWGMAPRLVADIMTRSVVTLNEEDNLSSVLEALDRYRFHHVPVVDDRRLVGVITQRDMLKLVHGNGGALDRARDEAYASTTFVADVMRREVVTVRADTPLVDAAKMMLRSRVGCLPVVDADRNLVGIVTEYDLLQLACTLLEGAPP